MYKRNYVRWQQTSPGGIGRFIIAVVIALLLAVPPAGNPVLAVPQPPHSFFGEVRVGANPAQQTPDSLIIEAKMGGITYVTTNTSGGNYGYAPAFLVPADDPLTSQIEGGADGETIEFFVQGVAAGSSIFKSASFTKLDLVIAALPTLSAPLNIQRTTPTNDPTPTFTWHAVAGAVSYVIRLDSASDWTNIGNVTTYTFSTTVSDGSHTFNIRALNSESQSGDIGSLPFNIDTTAPVLTINALTPDPTTDSTPTFTGVATDVTTTIASVEYRLDGAGSWIPASPVDGTFNATSENFTFTTSTLLDGLHSVQVRATDAAGNIVTQANYAGDSFTTDTTGPVLTLNTLFDIISDSTPTFNGTAIDAFSAIKDVSYRVDGAGIWLPASATDGTFNAASENFTFTTPVLEDGPHFVQVKADDLLGNETSATNFPIDIFIVSTAPAAFPAPGNVQWTTPMTDSTPTFIWNAVSSAVSYEVMVDSGSWFGIGNVTAYTAGTISDGSHIFKVRGINAAAAKGDIGSVLFTIDTTPPSVTISPLSPDPSTDNTPTFTGTATDVTTTIASVEYRVDADVTWTAASASDGAFNAASEAYTFTTLALADGAHTVYVRATDVAGNVVTSANYATDDFTITTVVGGGGFGGFLPPTTQPSTGATSNQTTTTPSTTPTTSPTTTPTTSTTTTTTTTTTSKEIEGMTSGEAAKVIEGLTNEKAIEVIGQVDTVKAAEIIKQFDTAKAAKILEGMTTAKVADIILQSATTGTTAAEKATSLSNTAKILEGMTTAKVADIILQSVTTGTTAAEKAASLSTTAKILEQVGTTKTAAILTEVNLTTAAAIMQQLTTEKLTDTIPAMSEKSLTERLPGLTAARLYSIEPSVLFSSLPNAPTEQLVGELPPEPPAELGPPISVYSTPSGAQYMAVKTIAGEWVIAMGTPMPVDKLLIKTKRGLENVTTTLNISDKPSSNVAVGLPTTVKALGYLDISFGNTAPEDIELGHITFQVDKEWLEQNLIHKWSVMLNRYDPDLKQWLPLPAKKVSEDDSYVFYSAVLNHFSEYAITGSENLASVSFRASHLVVSSAEVKSGDEVIISADITNLSDADGILAVSLWINSTVEAGQNVALKAGETKPVSFTVKKAKTGNYEVRIDRVFGSFRVTEAAEPPPEVPAKPTNIGLIIGIGATVTMLLVVGVVIWLMRRRGQPA